MGIAVVLLVSLLISRWYANARMVYDKLKESDKIREMICEYNIGKLYEFFAFSVTAIVYGLRCSFIEFVWIPIYTVKGIIDRVFGN